MRLLVAVPLAAFADALRTAGDVLGWVARRVR